MRDVFALQAQDTKAARLAVRVRSEGVDAAAVRRACNEERSVVRTWAMRGTLHMLPVEDLGWVVALLGPANAARDRRRRLELGLDDGLCERAPAAIRRVLADTGPLARGELVRRLARKGLVIAGDGQAPAHLVFLAAAQGLICRGPDLPNDEATYVLIDDWLGGAKTRAAGEADEAAWAELARRYVAAYAPVGVRDFAAWSGSAAGDARRAFERIAGELTEVTIDGADSPLWALSAGAKGRRGGDRFEAAADERPCVRLVPAFDAYFLGYRNRDFTLAPRFASRIQAGGRLNPAVLVDGQMVATWRRQPRAGGVVIEVEPFAPLAPEILPGLEAEAADIGRFLGTAAALEVKG